MRKNQFNDDDEENTFPKSSYSRVEPSLYTFLLSQAEKDDDDFPLPDDEDFEE